ncbi:MAG: DUF3021 domain-containing protein [Clostridiales bacterium]|nr:DUF3021 domain-containing protein [Clostridiales bacterium]
MRRFIKYLLYGISYGCTWFVLIGIIVTACGKGQAFSGTGFIEQAIAAAIVGIGFGTTSIIYESERLALPVQTIIHMGIGFAVFFAVGTWAGWVPFQAGAAAVAIFIVLEVIIGFAIWGCFCTYHRRLAKKMNKKIQERQKA